MVSSALYLLALASLALAENERQLGFPFFVPKIGDWKCQKVVMNGSYAYNSITRPEGERYYYTYTPTTQVRAVVLNLHHLSGYCEGFRRQSCIVTGAEENGWLVVTPCGLPGFLRWNSWNAGSCCQTNKDIDDYGFMRDLIATVRPHADIPVYAVGYSNGGMMAEGLLCRNMITRVVSVSGIITEGQDGLAACRSSYKHSAGARIGHVHGLLDILVPYTSGPASLVFNFPSVAGDMQTWASNMACGEPSETSRSIFDFEEWHGCDKGAKVVLVRNNLGGHFWWEVDAFSTSQFPINMLKD
ncbi:hypothetical protein FOL47_007763 [Perkinsus chesapeaki]|uniref:Uncharacterized protein n=1 Tax=Perkinsus chesapeaki TaxID=330153 RepID=A0A7J6LI91_PERCH|nr:hypothetical protein FOL47_007763 [Perkinsus chesapeaki]